MESPDDLMTTKEVAALLRVAPSTVVMFRRKGMLPSLKLGRAFFYRRGAVIEFIRTNEKVKAVI